MAQSIICTKILHVIKWYNTTVKLLLQHTFGQAGQTLPALRSGQISKSSDACLFIYLSMMTKYEEL